MPYRPENMDNLVILLSTFCNNSNGIYQISVGQNKVINVICQMSSVSGCSGGGWTVVMKINGSKVRSDFMMYVIAYVTDDNL